MSGSREKEREGVNLHSLLDFFQGWMDKQEEEVLASLILYSVHNTS